VACSITPSPTALLTLLLQNVYRNYGAEEKRPTPHIRDVSFSLGVSEPHLIQSIAVLYSNSYTKNQLDPFRRLAVVHQRSRQTQPVT